MWWSSGSPRAARSSRPRWPKGWQVRTAPRTARVTKPRPRPSWRLPSTSDGHSSPHRSRSTWKSWPNSSTTSYAASGHDAADLPEGSPMALNPIGDVIKTASRTINDAEKVLSSVGGTLSTVDGTLATVEGTLGTVEGTLGTVGGTLTSVDAALASVDARRADVDARLAEIVAVSSRVQEMVRVAEGTLLQTQETLARMEGHLAANA